MTTQLRTLGISAHVDAGKTTLAERILFYTGRIHALGDVRTERPPKLDHDPQEQARGITIRAAATTVTWGEATLHLVDTPGHVDFTVEVERSLQAMDGAVLVLCAVGGVQAQTRTVERQMARYGVPRVAFVNKCDRDGADPARVVRAMRDELGVGAVAVQWPVEPGPGFRAVVDLVEEVLVTFGGPSNREVHRAPVPDGLRAEVALARERMLDALSLGDDVLAEALLDEVATPDLVRAALRRGTLARTVVPVLFGAAGRELGVQPLLDAVVTYLPGPADRPRTARDGDADVLVTADPDGPVAALAFKLDDTEHGQLTWLRMVRGTLRPGARLVDGRTGAGHRVRRLVQLHADEQIPVDLAVAGDVVAAIGPTAVSGTSLCDPEHPVVFGALFVPAPVVERAVHVVSGSADKLGALLARQVREDPSLHLHTDPESGELRLRGMGELHLDVVARRLEDAGVEVALGSPVVTGRVALGGAVDFDHTLRKQSGGPGMYARIVGRVAPAEDFVFRWEVRGGTIPAEFRSAVEAGFREGLGSAAEQPVLGAEVTITDGDVHVKDSSDRAFHVAAREAFAEALARSRPRSLQPVMRVEVTAPAAHHGAVLSTLLSRGARVTDAELGRVVAEVPLAQMFGYASALRSATSGSGEHALEFLRYA